MAGLGIFNLIKGKMLGFFFFEKTSNSVDSILIMPIYFPEQPFSGVTACTFLENR